MKQGYKGISGEVSVSKALALEIERDVSNIPSLKEKISFFLNKSTSQIMEIVLAGGITLGTSDIHIEPEEEETKIRMRVDGVLQDVISLDKKTYKGVVSRIKLLSEVKLNVEDRPQDGRFSVFVPFREEELFIEIRMSALPSEYGETIVLRILDPRKLITLEQLGLRDDLFQLFKKEISKPNGMIIVTGPTGSGKTTTLYAFLKTIRNPSIKIITIEDPIEYHLEGISQTETHADKGYDFANGLRAIVRQDPDVILVGEVRDLETANIALQAALTGHLVFSTLHTNDAPGAVARLQSLGESPINISPAVNIVIAQRLIRKVCLKCAKAEEMPEDIVLKIKEELKNIKEGIFSFPESPEKLKVVGCRECGYTGYKGRVGIFEALVVNEEMEELILKSPSIAEIRKKAIESGMTTIRQDGLIKVLKKETTMEEVDRVT